MPDFCCAVGCKNVRKKGDDSRSFYRIPDEKKNPKLRSLWLTAINRKWSEKSISCARLCSDHFISGIYSYVLIFSSFHLLYFV